MTTEDQAAYKPVLTHETEPRSGGYEPARNPQTVALPYRDANIDDALELGYPTQEAIAWCVGFNTARSWLDALLTEADNAR